MQQDDVITPEQAGTLYGLFLERARRTPDKTAYRYFSSDITPASGHESSLKLRFPQCSVQLFSSLKKLGTEEAEGVIAGWFEQS